MTELTPSERRALRARAHALHPVVMIGSAGLTDAVLREIGLALRNHELIKVRMPGEAWAERDEAMHRICAELDAAPVQHIGKILVIFRPRPQEVPQTELATAAPRFRGKGRTANRSKGSSRSGMRRR